MACSRCQWRRPPADSLVSTRSNSTSATHTPQLPHSSFGPSGTYEILANTRSPEAPAAADSHLHVSPRPTSPLCAQQAREPARQPIRVHRDQLRAQRTSMGKLYLFMINMVLSDSNWRVLVTWLRDCCVGAALHLTGAWLAVYVIDCWA